jgi:hypothetical protein
MKVNTKKQKLLKKETPVSAAEKLRCRVEKFFERNERPLFVASMLLSALMSILLFDVKVSLSGDDCDYLIAADNFWRHFTYPGYHGAFYPIVISPLIGILGIKLLLLKSLSVVFMLLSVWLFYKTFRGIVPPVVLTPALFLTSICSYIFFYAGHTYSEPLFMLVQGLLLYFFAKYFLGKEDVSYSLKADWRKYLIIGVLALCLALTRTIGYGVVGAIILFMALQRRWKDLLYMLGAFAVVFGLFHIFKSILWPGTGAGGYSSQLLFAKDPYNPALGQEDFAGLVKRFVENSKVYLSAFLYQFMGLIPETPSYAFKTDTARTIGIYLFYAGCLVFVFKRSKALLFVGLYAGIMNFASFVVLASRWAQDRLIMVYYPLILLLFLGGVYYLFQSKKRQSFFFIYPLLLLAICIGTLSITSNKVKQNLPVLQQNMLGDQLYGLTPDWVNFIKASQWAAKNLDKDAQIVSRKPTMSKVYTGRDFTITPTVLPIPLDTLTYLKSTEDRKVIAIDASQGVYQGDVIRYMISRVSGAPALRINGAEVNMVCVYLMPNDYIAELLPTLDSRKVNYTLDYDTFVEDCKSIGNVRIYDPEMMYQYLKEHHISYLLLSKLRIYPPRNTGEYINDVHRYFWYISFKYPESFRIIHTVGEDETCEIVEFIP